MKRYAAEFVARYPDQAPPHVRGTLAKLSLCRTAALGGHEYRCDKCRETTYLYNSCGDRHCPQCSGAKRADWMDSAQSLLLEGVPYFQVVATLPQELSALALGNRREMYDLLFTAGWMALKRTIEAEQGFDPTALGVLHTWNQKLEAHAHVHFVVQGGGPALGGQGGWVGCRKEGHENPYYLVDAEALRTEFRRCFLAGLTRLHRASRLRLEGDFAHLRDTRTWNAFVRQLADVKWVVYIEPPPAECCSSENVLKYLTRYLTGGPIGDQRLIDVAGDSITFWAREGTVAGGDRQQVPCELAAVEFVRRWCLHILPQGYTKTRRFGGWSSRRRDAYVERCAMLLESVGDLPENGCDFSVAEDQILPDDESVDTVACPGCGEPMRLIEVREKPRWCDVMSSDACPSWYRPTAMRERR